MDWNAWMDRVREYEERTFADYIDGGYDMYATDEDAYDNWDEDAYDE